MQKKNQKKMGNAPQKGKKEEDRSVLVFCWKKVIFQKESVCGWDKLSHPDTVESVPKAK